MSKKKPAVKNRATVVFFEGTVTLNGVTRKLRSIEYERVELEDGTVREKGLPAGVKSGDVSGVIRKAFE